MHFVRFALFGGKMFKFRYLMKNSALCALANARLELELELADKCSTFDEKCLSSMTIEK